MHRSFIQVALTFVVAAIAFRCGHAQGVEDPVTTPPPPLPPPLWSDDSPVAAALKSRYQRSDEIVSSDAWGLATDDRLRTFRPRHEQLLRECLNYEAACRGDWKQHSDTITHRANFLFARTMTDRALYIMLLQDLNDLSGCDPWQRRPGEGEDGTVALVRSVLDHMEVVEDQIRQRFWIDEQGVHHGEWQELGILRTDFAEVRR